MPGDTRPALLLISMGLLVLFPRFLAYSSPCSISTAALLSPVCLAIPAILPTPLKYSMTWYGASSDLGISRNQTKSTRSATTWVFFSGGRHFVGAWEGSHQYQFVDSSMQGRFFRSASPNKPSEEHIKLSRVHGCQIDALWSLYWSS